ncbi:hypothetical protein POSPLADRAFT_1139353 [Postia placenta MAD-698-R-SB12]|uniref:Uncharacterized protein n=1 Tax=Postia placenta MAD-698-R-SB12 TaxID=670580 RepID=A0A1X6N5F4_9APHY|nr:hypothetical protein POSPLADRAFT_1139353 [Postia placenta MAD-698-R-SB12]OSX63706.1 hypothetical protein POSPLADRAFT_1139353 [Postia placenta MAD-698-R-SB12]
MSDQQRVAIITGAAQGIGRAIALRLAKDGIHVALNDIPNNADNLARVAEEVQAQGGRSTTILADVSVEHEVKAMVAKAVEDLGSVDVMIANAGISPVGSILDMSVETWDRIMDVNLRGVMLCYKYAALQMIKQGRGGRILGAINFSAYSASKFGVRGLTQSLVHRRNMIALELAEHNITVNAYCPGVIITPMTSVEDDAQYGGKPGARVKAWIGAPPDGPDAGPEVIASIVSYLVKPEAYFITGQSIHVNGGAHVG